MQRVRLTRTQRCELEGGIRTKLTEESTSRKDRGDEGLLGRGDGKTERVGSTDGDGFTEELEPVLHGGDARDGTGIITEEDTSEGSERDHEDTREFGLGSIGTNASACSNRTSRHDA